MCREMKKKAIKYELGELDMFQSYKFEEHVKGCPICKKRYKTALLLGGLLYSSKKIHKENFLNAFFSTALVKGFLGVVLLTPLLVYSGNRVYRERMDVEKLNVVHEDVKGTAVYPTIEESLIYESGSDKEEVIVNSIKVRSIQGEREVEISVDRESLKVRERVEK